MEIIETNNNDNDNNNSEFPEGMRVLAVDDNVVCLTLLTALLNNCRYQVTSLTNKTEALQLLTQNVENFDIILTNVYMNEMEGFKLVEAGRELNIPVIMISSHESKDIIMKGLSHGAVHYLIKPVRLESIQTIWQHVYRNKFVSSSFPWVNEDVRDDITREDDQSPVKGQSEEKKERIKWTRERQEKFIKAVQVLGGVEKAVPKKILELMDEPELRRAQIGSHLQKFRNSFKKEPKPGTKKGPKQTNSTHNNHHHHPTESSAMGSNISTQAWSFGPSYNFGFNNNDRRVMMNPSIGCPTQVQNNNPFINMINEPVLPSPMLMGSSPSFMVGHPKAEHTQSVFGPTMQSPEEVFDTGSYMIDSTNGFSLNNIFNDIAPGCLSSFEFPEDGQKDGFF